LGKIFVVFEICRNWGHSTIRPPAFQRSSNFFLLPTYLPTYRAKRCSERMHIVVVAVDEVDFVAARPHCKSPSFIVGHQRTAFRVENRPERKREADKLEVGLTMCCCWPSVRELCGIFSIFLVEEPIACNEVMSVYKGYKDLDQYIMKIISRS